MAMAMAKHNELPTEMIMEILSRVPADSLLQFKLVCKSWLRLICNPKFVAKHLLNFQLHTDSSATILLRRLIEKESGTQENIFSFLAYPVPDDDPSVVDIDLPYFKDCKSLEICGHTHGIVCISDQYMEIVLCNPATREFRRLPPSIVHLTEQTEEFDSCTDLVGFGYDPKSNDFKVVRVVRFCEAPSFFHPSRVEVYDLSTDCWREIQNPVLGSYCYSPSCHIYHRGIYYWFALSIKGEKEIIQSFDMSHEVFGMIPIPESFETEDPYYTSMGVWKGSIVVFHYAAIGNPKHFDVWLMEKDEFAGILWSKLFRIGPISGLEMPLVFINSEKAIFEAENGKLVVYSLNTNELKYLPVKGHPENFQATLFSKSLLSVKGGTRLHLGATSEVI